MAASDLSDLKNIDWGTLKKVCEDIGGYAKGGTLPDLKPIKTVKPSDGDYRRKMMGEFPALGDPGLRPPHIFKYKRDVLRTMPMPTGFKSWDEIELYEPTEPLDERIEPLDKANRPGKWGSW